ncbi:hypothetical protein MMC13_005368 [Lambiella insularis]|nr:hypothetical protein [Lambiella insularis]
MDEHLFESLLGIEDQFYEEGYKLGAADGTRAGHIEGRLFGLEKGFEKFLEMGKLYGRSLVWASRLQHNISSGQELNKTPCKTHDAQTSMPFTRALLPPLPDSARLEKHVQTFHALVELESLSTQNKEEDVSEFDDRFKRAIGKAKIIEKSIGEDFDHNIVKATPDKTTGVASRTHLGIAGIGSIEDISMIHVRQ